MAASLELILGFILTMVELIGKYGLPATIAIIQSWTVGPEGITQEDIDRLRNLVPPPGTYFEEKPS